MSNKCLHEVYDKTIRALVSAIEIRGPYPLGHHQRVADLAHAIAEEIGLPNSQLEGLCVASLTHDIGKTSVPLSVLRQDPTQLSGFEREIFRTHPKTAYDLLKEIDFPWPVAQIVLQHHESLDGSGYPEGLLGQDILLEARILTVANVVETLTSHQPYRPALGIDEATKEIVCNKGRLFDPEVVDTCVQLFTEQRIQSSSHANTSSWVRRTS